MYMSYEFFKLFRRFLVLAFILFLKFIVSMKNHSFKSPNSFYKQQSTQYTNA